MKGGVALSQGNESCLRFSLEESVWFQKGQEVEELVSISLDPNITIHENEQYVTIQGALELTGEYQRYNDGSNEEEDLFTAPKFVHHVEEREEGLCEFSHRFPVDITIPNNRIQSIDDIHVEVESFDYLFQERSCMKLTADLTITGLYGDQQHKPVYEEVEVEDAEEVQLEVAYREATTDEEIEENVEVSNELETREQEDVTVSEQEYEPFAVEARKSADDEEEKVVPINKSVELFDAPQLPVNEPKEPEITFSAARSEIAQEVPKEEVVEETQEAPLQPILEVEHQELPELQPQAEIQTEAEVESSSSPQPKFKKKKSSKKGMSLTEFFARKEETEDLTKLRVAIVQSGETVEQLAARYEVPVQQLLKVNHLELNQDIYEGQVLYIPIPIAHK